MRVRRSLALFASAALMASGLATVALTAPAQAADVPLQACGTSVPKPCIVSFTRNGSTSVGDFSVSGLSFNDTGGRQLLMHIEKAGGDNGGLDLGAAARADTFSVTLDMGTMVPRIAAGKARDVSVTRKRSGGGFLLTITGKAILLAGQCDQSAWPWRCPEKNVVVNDPGYFNNVQWDGLWSAEIYDADYIDDTALRNSLYGLDYFHNFAASEIPPQVQISGPDDVASLVISIANRRYLDDLSTLVVGHAELRIPDSFLRVGYGITDIASMTGSSVSVTGSGSGATTTVTHDEAGGALRVLIDNVTFPDIMVADGELRQRAAASSTKVLKVKRGVIKPKKGKVSFTNRIGPRKGSVGAKKAKARGAKITGYQAACIAGKSVVTAKSKSRTVVLTGLTAGRGYKCKVRALSKAGPGGYSKAVGLAARP